MIGKVKNLIFELFGYLLIALVVMTIVLIGLTMLGMLVRFIIFLWSPVLTWLA